MPEYIVTLKCGDRYTRKYAVTAASSDDAERTALYLWLGRDDRMKPNNSSV